MSIWRTTSIQEVPEIQLRNWQIMETERGERHFIGYNITEGAGRVSSAIQEFDIKNRRGITNSGRIYELLGDPGNNLDAEYVWNRWKVINTVIIEKNVTEEFLFLEEN